MARCIVCRNEQGAVVRRIARTFGDEDSALTVALNYCADRADCGEAAAASLIELLAAPFIAADVRRDGVCSIEDVLDRG